ncbi:MAG TPA: hypothetical protein DDX85_11415 [Nitrospiraceae bacterium]|nr:hypothetical protein [Nitrospiraceae bacterium]
MADDRKQQSDAGEQRSFFRIDDIISVVANPVHVDRDKAEAFRKQIVSSKAFSLIETPGMSQLDSEDTLLENHKNTGLYPMMAEIQTKLDFIINHLMLDKEGLLRSEKKVVNISASGIRFTIEHPVKVNEIMEIKLLLPTYPPVAVFAYGEVKRVKDLGDNKHEVSLEYLNMDESVRNEIIQYTLSHQRETIRKSKESGAK